MCLQISAFCGLLNAKVLFADGAGVSLGLLYYCFTRAEISYFFPCKRVVSLCKHLGLNCAVQTGRLTNLN